jgi:hypothetical protein
VFVHTDTRRKRQDFLQLQDGAQRRSIWALG